MATASLTRCYLLSFPIIPLSNAAAVRSQLPFSSLRRLLLAPKKDKVPSFSRSLVSSPSFSRPRAVAGDNGRSPVPAEPNPSRELYLYSTLSKEKELFRPRVPGKVGMYVCGVTAYDLSHIGHARVYVTFDVLYRYLQHLKYEVCYVRNFTDVDDKES